MKKANQILLTAAFFILINALSSAGTVDPPYEVGTWQGFCAAAITFTFDDHRANQFAIALPMLNEFDFDATFYPVPDWSPPWASLQAAAAEGHEVGSHTMSHSNLSGMSTENQIYEYSTSQSTINSYIPGNQCLTIAYPFCNIGTQSIIDDYFIAGRICGISINPSTPSNFYTIDSIVCGSEGTIKGKLAFVENFTSAAASNGWGVYLLHGIDDDGGYSPFLSERFYLTLQYLDENRDTYWVQTFLNVVRYIKERNDVSVTESASDERTITVQITDTLDNTIYNYPVTIRRPLPEGWPGANATQNGQPVPCSVVQVDSTAYVMFDVVPDACDVVLIKALNTPEGLRATPDTNDVSLDWNDNTESYLTGYNVYRSTTYGDDYSKINSSLLSSSDYNDVNVPLDTTYYYVVTAEDINSFETGYSNQAVVFGDLYGDFMANDVVDLNDLAIFLDYWPVNDCNETAGVDTDDNCIVNFSEFASLAKNWL